MVVYVEQVALVNFMADGTLLWAAGRLWGRPPAPGRWAAAAGAAALGSWVPVLAGMNGLIRAGLLALILALTVRLCWGKCGARESLRLWGTLWAATWLAAGAATALLSLTGPAYGLACGACGCAAMALTARLALPGWRRGQRACHLRIRRGVGRDFGAWLDTGNALAEPVSGLPVIVASPRLVLALAADIPQGRPVPCQTAAGSALLSARRVENLQILSGRRWQPCGPVYLAAADRRLPPGVEALVPPLPCTEERGDGSWRRCAV